MSRVSPGSRKSRGRPGSSPPIIMRSWLTLRQKVSVKLSAVLHPSATRGSKSSKTKEKIVKTRAFLFTVPHPAFCPIIFCCIFHG